MKFLSLATLGIVTLTGFVAVACTDQPSEPTIRHSISAAPQRSALLDAPGLIHQALAGVHVRGEQDWILRFEAELPGFGGLFVDSVGEVAVYMKSEGAAEPVRVRQILGRAFALRESPVREVMAPVSRARILEAQYSLSELIAIENRIGSHMMGIPGLVGVGTSLAKNRVKVGFDDSLNISKGLASLAQLGVPLNALIPETWGRMRLVTTWSDKTRPTRGGIQIGVFRGNSIYGGSGSHGFNIQTGNGTKYFMMASHVINVNYAVNGATGDTIYQPTKDSFYDNRIGTVAVNPMWDTLSSCPLDSASMSYPDFCTQSDVALGTFINGVTGERKIGTSTREGQNGDSGTPTINNWYPIAGVLSPEYVKNSILGTHKSGFATGTTTGIIDPPLAKILLQIPWPALPKPPTAWKYILYYNVTRVTHAGWGSGDSGAPVFAGNGSPYYALGSVTTAEGSGDPCTSGQACAFYFSRWANIEQALGLGPLSPVT